MAAVLVWAPSTVAAERGIELVSPEGSEAYPVRESAGSQWPVVAQEDGDVLWLASSGTGDPAREDGGADDVFLARRSGIAQWSSSWLTEFDAPAALQVLAELRFGTRADRVAYGIGADLAPNDHNGSDNPFFSPVDLYAGSVDGQTLLSAAPGGVTGGSGVDISNRPASTPDVASTIFASRDQLLDDDDDGSLDIYLRRPDELVLVSRNSDGTANNEFGDSTFTAFTTAAPGGYPANHGFTHVSDDGSTVVFLTSVSLDPDDGDSLRDVYVWHNGDVTIASDRETAGPDCDDEWSCGDLPAFVGMSEDGARVYLSTGERLTADDQDDAVDIYEYAPVGGDISLATGGAEQFTPAYASAVSADGDLFFATTESLAGAGALTAAGALYRWDGADISVVAKRGASDAPPGSGLPNDPTLAPEPRRVRASLDGNAFVFVSEARLDGSDTDDGADVYLWRDGQAPLLVSGSGSAPALPGAAGYAGGSKTIVAGRIISSKATRVFFSSVDALTGDAPDDGSLKLYEWEQGAGIELVAAAKDGVTYADSTPTGDDVFFRTSTALAAGDTDGGELDLYDARVGSPGSPPPAGGGSVGAAPSGAQPTPVPAPPTLGSMDPAPTEQVPPPSLPPSVDPHPQTEPSVDIVRRSLTLRGRAVVVRIEVSVSAEVRLRLRKRGGRVLARGTATITEAGKPQSVKLRMTRAGRRATRPGRTVRAVLQTVVVPAEGGSRTRDRTSVRVLPAGTTGKADR